jgi:hypothetical protein
MAHQTQNPIAIVALAPDHSVQFYLNVILEENRANIPYKLSENI